MMSATVPFCETVILQGEPGITNNQKGTKGQMGDTGLVVMYTLLNSYIFLKWFLYVIVLDIILVNSSLPSLVGTSACVE